MTDTPSAWQVQATVTYTLDDTEWTGKKDIPTFILPIDLGICIHETACRVATEIIDPLGKCRSVNLNIRPIID